MYITSAMKKKEQVDTAFVAMGTQANKEIFCDLGMDGSVVSAAGPNDMIIGIRVASGEICEQAIGEIQEFLDGNGSSPEKKERSFSSIESAVKENKKANLCITPFPGSSEGRGF